MKGRRTLPINKGVPLGICLLISYSEESSLGSSGVEHILGKDEAMGSNPISGLTNLLLPCELFIGYDGWRAAVFFVSFI